MPEIIMRGKALEDTLKEVIEFCYWKFPHEMKQMEEVVAAESACLVKPTALSQDGSMMDFCKITPKLYACVKYIMRKHHGIPDFWADRANYYFFTRLFTKSRIKHKPTKMFRIEGPQT